MCLICSVDLSETAEGKGVEGVGESFNTSKLSLDGRGVKVTTIKSATPTSHRLPEVKRGPGDEGFTN